MKNYLNTRIYLRGFAGLIACALTLCLYLPETQAELSVADAEQVELHQALLDLTNSWTVMCVAAHPDDEDGSTLTILRRKFGFNTVTLFSTYGEGGQNVIGQEVGEALGVIRAHETIAASELQGSEPHFLGLTDFGFSKSAEETFRIWGRNEALRRMVLKIRELRPDVIITNHNPTGGHGHHQATGQLLEEAFAAAADPQRFPEQLKEFAVWQPQRLFVRFGFRPEPVTSIPETERGRVININPNEPDPVRGTTFAEQALAALRLHATQGPWPKSIPAAGARLIRYRLVRQATGSAPLPDNASTFVAGLSAREPDPLRFGPTIDNQPLTEFVTDRQQVLASLIEYRRALPETPSRTGNSHRQQLMAKRLDHAIATAAGISLGVNSPARLLVPAISTKFVINLSGGSRPARLERLSFAAWGKHQQVKTADQLKPNTQMSVAVEHATPVNIDITVPRADHLYDGLLFGHVFEATAELAIDGARLSLRADTRLQAAQAVTIESISPSPYVIIPATINRPLSLDVTLTNNLSTPFHGTLKLSSPEFNVLSPGREVSLDPNQTITVKLTSSKGAVNINDRPRANHASGRLVVSLEGPKTKTVVTQRAVRASYNDARVTAGLKIGYLPSFDNTLATSLAALNVDATPLTVAGVSTNDLSRYHAIIIDNRGYEAHPQLIQVNQRLLDYVQAGGTLIVFYHKSNEWNPDPGRGRTQLAPYPIILGSARVTEEDAKVTFLRPEHRLLNVPNRIGASDFENWVQERGLYYPREWDQNYEALLAMNDKDEEPLRGGLLVARYGEGTYIYTSMVWYRQLLAGVPGAYRIFANMISYGKK